MEYYAQGQGAPSSFTGLEGTVSDLSSGPVLTSLPLSEDWHLRHGAHSPASTGADTALEEVVWQMTLQPPEGMDAPQGQYPERPGEPDCTYYMRTGLCGFGMSCRFNHPPNRKLAAAVARGKGEYPERHGQPECQENMFLLKERWDDDKQRQSTKPYMLPVTPLKIREEFEESTSIIVCSMVLCVMSTEYSCFQGDMSNCEFIVPSHWLHWSPNVQVMYILVMDTGKDYRVPAMVKLTYYLKTGTCKFGATCKYHHPREKAGSTGRVQLNVLNLPLRPGEKECAYYMRTGSCKYSVTCKFHHPPPTTLVPISASPIYATAGGPSLPAPQPYPGGLPTWPIARAPYMPSPRIQGPSSYGPMLLPAQGIVSMPGWSTYQGPVGPIASPEGQQHPMGTGFVYTQQTDPVAGGIHGSFPPYLPGTTAMGLPALQPQQSLGSHKDMIFPERPGQPECQYYMKTGDCKFGITCKYHHPKDRATPSPTCGLSPMGLPLRPGAQPCTFYTRYGICKFGPTCKFDHPLGGLPYSPSASSLTDMPVAPFPLGASATTLAPSSSESPYDSTLPGASTSNEPTSHPEGPTIQNQTREGSSEVAQAIVSTAQAGQVLSLQGLSLGTGGNTKQVDILGTS